MSSRPSSSLAVGVAVLVLLGMAAPPAAAQGGWSLGASATANLMVGNEFLNSGFGVDATAGRELSGSVGARADLLAIRIAPDDSGTDPAGNTLVVVALGPELELLIPPLALYARGLGGLAANRRGRPGPDGRMSWAGAVGGGAGVRFALGPSLSLDLGGDLVKLGELAFVGSAVASQESTEDPAVLRLRAGLRFGG